MQPRTITFSIESSLKNASLIGLAVNKICQSVALSEEEAYQSELCVIEAVNNSIEHAYQDETGNTVSVVLRIYADKITFDICDSGKEFRPNLEPFFTFDPNDVDNLPEGGMGRYLMNQIMDVVEYDHVNGQNILRLTKKLCG